MKKIMGRREKKEKEEKERKEEGNAKEINEER